MAKTWPDLSGRFIKSIDASLSLVGNTEALWLTSPPTSEVRKKLKVPQLEALYEAVYLQMFGTWEAFLESVTLRWMAKYSSPGYSPTPASGTVLYKSVQDAVPALYLEHGNLKNFLLWHNPSHVRARVARHLTACPIEQLMIAESVSLDQFSAVRHHIAHGSNDTRAKFKAASLALTGSDHGGRPGRMLRNADISDPLNTPKWIRSIAEALKQFAVSVCS